MDSDWSVNVRDPRTRITRDAQLQPTQQNFDKVNLRSSFIDLDINVYGMYITQVYTQV